MTNEEITLHRGLQGVYFDRSATTYIDGKQGILEYRGYNINDLAEHSTFEETAYLLIHGKLPNQSEFDAFDAELKAARELPEQVFDVLDIVKDSHPMDALRTAVSALASFDEDREDNSAEATIRKGVRLTSQVPSIVMAHHNIRQGKDPIKPSSTLNHAGNFLYMLNGDEPSQEAIELMDKDFVLHADHGSNASAFTARVVAGTSADLHGAVTAGIAALSGPSHGGAAENVMQMAREIGKPENAADYVQNLLSNRQRVMGFGHRVYKNYDPRAKVMQQTCHEVLEELGVQDDPVLAMARELERIALEDEYFVEKKLYPNVDFYSGIILKAIGIPVEMFTVIFATGRTPGWIAHWCEMIGSSYKIGRPRQLYTGSTKRDFVDVADR